MLGVLAYELSEDKTAAFGRLVVRTLPTGVSLDAKDQIEKALESAENILDELGGILAGTWNFLDDEVVTTIKRASPGHVGGLIEMGPISATDNSKLHEITRLLDEVTRERGEQPDWHLEVKFDREIDSGATESAWYEYFAIVDFSDEQIAFRGETSLRVTRHLVLDQEVPEAAPQHLLPLEYNGDAVATIGTGVKGDKNRAHPDDNVEASLKAAKRLLRQAGFTVSENDWDIQGDIARAGLTLLPLGGQPKRTNWSVEVHKPAKPVRYVGEPEWITTYRSRKSASSFRVITYYAPGAKQIDVRVVKGHETRNGFVEYLNEEDITEKRLLRILEQYLDGYRPTASDLPDSRSRP